MPAVPMAEQEPEPAVTALPTPSKVVFGSPSRRRQVGPQGLAVVSDAYPWLLVYLKELVTRVPDVKVPAKAIQLGFVTNEQLKQVIRQLPEDEVLYFNKHADEQLQVAMGTCKGQNMDPSTAMLDDYMHKLKSRRYKQDEDWRAPSRLSDVRPPGQSRPAQQEAEPAYTFIFEEHARRMTAAAVIQRKWRAWRQYCAECGRPLHALRWDIRRVQVDLRNAYAMANPGRMRAQRFLTDQEYKAKYQMLTSAEAIMTRLVERHSAEQNSQQLGSDAHLHGMRQDLQELNSMIKQVTTGLEEAGLGSSQSSPHHRASDSGTAARSRRGSMMGGTETGRPQRRISFTNGLSDDNHFPSAESGRPLQSRSRLGPLSGGMALSTRIRAELRNHSDSGARLPGAGDSDSDSDSDDDAAGLPLVDASGKLLLHDGMSPMEKAKRVAASMLQYLGPSLRRPVGDLADEALRQGGSRLSTSGSARPSTAGGLDDEGHRADALTNASAVKAEAKQVLRDLLFDKPHGHSLALLDRVTSSVDKEDLALKVQNEVARIHQAREGATQPTAQSVTSHPAASSRPKSQGAALKLKKSEMLQALRTSPPPTSLKSPKQGIAGATNVGALLSARNPLAGEPLVVRVDMHQPPTRNSALANADLNNTALTTTTLTNRPLTNTATVAVRRHRGLTDNRLDVHSDPGACPDLQSQAHTQHAPPSPLHSPTCQHVLPALEPQRSKPHGPGRSTSPPKSPTKLHQQATTAATLLLGPAKQPIDLIISPFQVPEHTDSPPCSPARGRSMTQLAGRPSQAQVAMDKPPDLQVLTSLSLTTKQLLPQPSQPLQQQPGSPRQQASPRRQLQPQQQQGQHQEMPHEQDQAPQQERAQQQLLSSSAAEPEAERSSPQRPVTYQEVAGLAEPSLLTPATSYQPVPQMLHPPTQASQPLVPHPGSSPSHSFPSQAQIPHARSSPSHSFTSQAQSMQQLAAKQQQRHQAHVSFPQPPIVSPSQLLSPSAMSPKPSTRPLAPAERLQPLMLGALAQESSSLHLGLAVKPEASGASLSSMDRFASQLRQELEHMRPLHLDASPQPASSIQPMVQGLQGALAASKTEVQLWGPSLVLAESSCPALLPAPSRAYSTTLQPQQNSHYVGDTADLAQFRAQLLAQEQCPAQPHPNAQPCVNPTYPPHPNHHLPDTPSDMLFVGRPAPITDEGAPASPVRRLSHNGSTKVSPAMALAASAFPQPTVKTRAFALQLAGRGMTRSLSGYKDSQLAGNGTSGHMPGEYDPEPLTDDEDTLAAEIAARPRSTHFTRRMRDQNRPAPNPSGSTILPTAASPSHAQHSPAQRSSLTSLLLPPLHALLAGVPIPASSTVIPTGFRASCSEVGLACEHSYSSLHTPARHGKVPMHRAASLQDLYTSAVPSLATPAASTGLQVDKRARPSTPSTSCKTGSAGTGRLVVVAPVVPGAAKLVLAETTTSRRVAGNLHLPHMGTRRGL